MACNCGKSKVTKISAPRKGTSTFIKVGNVVPKRTSVTTSAGRASSPIRIGRGKFKPQ